MRSLRDLAAAAVPPNHWSRLPQDIALNLVFPHAALVNPDAALTLVTAATDTLEVPLNSALDVPAALATARHLRRFVVAGPCAQEWAALLPDTLEELVLSDVDPVSPATLAELAGRLRQLRVLSLRSARRVMWTATAFASPHMESLCLRGLSASAAVLCALFETLPRLVDVDLSEVVTVTDAVIDVLVRRHPALAALSLEGCVRVTDASVRALGTLRGLVFLCVADTPRVRHLEALPASLQHLQVSYKFPPALVALPHLVSLICSFNRTLDATYFSASAEEPLSLRTLGLVGCVALDDHAVAIIAQRCAATLDTLNVSRCPLLTNAAIASLAACSHLRELGIGDLPLLTDVAPLATCGQLRTLVVGGCPVTDLGAVVRACAHLEVLHAGSTALTDASLVALFGAHAPPSLERLDLSDCHVGADTARVILRACHCLKSLNMEMLGNTDQRKAVQMFLSLLRPRTHNHRAL